MQPIFYRVTRMLDLPAGDFIEAWAHYAYNNGIHDLLPMLTSHKIDTSLMERIAGIFKDFLKEASRENHLPDISLPMSELFRFYLMKRSVTDENTLFFYSLGVHMITLSPEDNIIHRIEEFPADEIPDEADEVEFSFDMRKLWPVIDTQSLEKIEQSSYRYLFFTGREGEPVVIEKTGNHPG